MIETWLQSRYDHPMLRKLDPTEEFKFNRAQIRTKQDLQNYLTEDFSLIFFEQFSSGKGNSNWNRSYVLFVNTLLIEDPCSGRHMTL